MLTPLSLENLDHYQNNSLLAPRKGTGLPHGHGLRAIKMLGKGSNNVVFLYKTRDGQHAVVRQPRRKSDTQRSSNAVWEFRNTAVAMGIGVAPLLYDAWYSRHSTAEQRGGLHIVCEYFPNDVHELLVENPGKAIGLQKQLREMVVQHIRAMADNGLFCYDLKPSNMVYSTDPLRVRFIDFGRDFCEWRPYSATNEYLERAPVLSFVQTLAEQHATSNRPAMKIYSDLAFAAMLVILSSNFAFTIDSSRTASRRGFHEGVCLNFMASAAEELRFTMRGDEVALLKMVLRQRDIRDTLRHYLGRRNCGTKRTFAYAGFKRAKLSWEPATGRVDTSFSSKHRDHGRSGRTTRPDEKAASNQETPRRHRGEKKVAARANLEDTEGVRT